MANLQVSFVRDLVNGRAKLQKEDIRKALAEGKPSEEVGFSNNCWSLSLTDFNVLCKSRDVPCTLLTGIPSVSVG